MSNDKCGNEPADRPAREAAYWLAKLQHPELSPRMLMRWNKWQQSAPNREAFDSLESLWRSIRSASDNAKTKAADRGAQLATVTALISQKSPDRIVTGARLASEEAAHWYFLCVDDQSTLRSDRREFLAWVRRSPENIAELFKIAQLDGKLRQLQLAIRSLGLTTSHAVEPSSFGTKYSLHREIKGIDDDERPVKNERALSFKLGAVAGSVCFGVALAYVAQDYIQPAQVITTGAGEWHRMTLPDGTTVHVDARSRVRVEYSDEARIMRVFEGGVVFDVAKDPKRPFIARTDLIDATAVGTKFGISIDPDVTTTVSEGVVKVTGRGKADGKAVTLNAGEELRVSDSSLASKPAQVDADRKLQWANGLLILGGLTVSQGVEQLNRRNRIQIVVESPTLGKKIVEFASVNVDAPETYARIVAAEPGVAMIIDEQKGVIRLSE